MKYDKSWHMNRGFKYYRMNRSKNKIELLIKQSGRCPVWQEIEQTFSTYRQMYDHFQGLLSDDYSLQDDEK